MIRNCGLIKSSRRNLIEVAAASIAGHETASSAAQLVAEAGTDCDASASLRTAAAEHGGSALGLHAGPKAVRLNPLAAVGLKCALGHGNALLVRLRSFEWYVEFCALTASLKYSADKLSNPVLSVNCPIWNDRDPIFLRVPNLLLTTLFQPRRRV
jgi:hypothetical protein